MSSPNHIPVSIHLPSENVIIIVLTKGYITIIDTADADLAKIKWSIQVDTYGGVYAVHSRPKDENGYRGSESLHRVVLERKLGRSLNPGEECDHISTVRMDNRRENLRTVSRTQNLQNKPLYANSTSGYKGVTKDRKTGHWRARIGVNGKRLHLGLFLAPEEAYAAYCEAAKRYFGEFARFF